MNTRVTLIVVLILPLWQFQTSAGDANGARSKMRTWTDSTGGFAVEAQCFFFDAAEGKVYLRRVDGRILTVPIGRLSEADQQLVKSFFGDKRVDPICGLLFEEYVRGLKVNGIEQQMACELIASRGRKEGFWRNVLAELQRDDKRTERACVQMLGKMLAADADARKIMNGPGYDPNRVAQPSAVCLGERVVDELTRRAQRADDLVLGVYLIALVRSRDPRTRQLFGHILRHNQRRQQEEEEAMRKGPPAFGDSPPPRNAIRKEDLARQKEHESYCLTAEFYSAVGLAQLGDSLGIEWLIAHCDIRVSDPLGYPGGGLATRPGFPHSSSGRSQCRTALKTVAGQDFKTRAEWEAWWDGARESFKPRGHIHIVEDR